MTLADVLQLTLEHEKYVSIYIYESGKNFPEKFVASVEPGSAMRYLGSKFLESEVRYMGVNAKNLIKIVVNESEG